MYQPVKCSGTGGILQHTLAYTRTVKANPNLRHCRQTGEGTELFIVEGMSAANAVDQIRSRAHQAVYSMQGKIPNPARHKLDKLLKNPHLERLFDTLGYSLETLHETHRPDRDSLYCSSAVADLGATERPETSGRMASAAEQSSPVTPYAKILIVCDADVDGLHSRSLLVDLLTRYFSHLVEAGRVATINTPAYRINDPLLSAQAETQRVGGIAAQYPQYLYSELAKHQLFARCQQDSQPLPNLTQFKGLAAMQPTELAECILDPRTRHEIDVRELRRGAKPKKKARIKSTGRSDSVPLRWPS